MIFKKNLPKSKCSNSRFDFVIQKISLPKSKCSQSEVITSVLLILIAISAIVIVMAFAIPFVKDRLSGSDCIKVIDKVEIRNNAKYSCYDSSDNLDKKLRVQVHFGDVNESLKGFAIEAGGAETKSFRIFPGTVEGISMYNVGDSNLKLPGNNEDKTYVIRGINEKPDFIRVYPILTNGKICDSSSTLTNINNC